jgi:hypothetical protein
MAKEESKDVCPLRLALGKPQVGEGWTEADVVTFKGKKMEPVRHAVAMLETLCSERASAVPADTRKTTRAALAAFLKACSDVTTALNAWPASERARIVTESARKARAKGQGQAD